MVKKIIFSTGLMIIAMSTSFGLALTKMKVSEGPDVRNMEDVEVSGIVQAVQSETAIVELQDGTLIILREQPDFWIGVDSPLSVQGQRLDDNRIVANRFLMDGVLNSAPAAQPPPIMMDFTGQVDAYDTNSGVVTIDGVTGILLHMPEDAIQVDTYLSVSGELLRDGRLLIDTYENFQPPEFVPLDESGVSAVCHIPPDELSEPYSIIIETGAVPIHLAHGDYQGACDGSEASIGCQGMCNPLLIVLADAFNASYAEFAELKQMGLGVGDLAQIYAVADVTDAKPQELAQSRAAGISWQEILQSQPLVHPDVLASRSILGDGRGSSIRATQ